MEELFWLGMGYDSDDGEKDASYNSRDGSEEESLKEDTFDYECRKGRGIGDVKKQNTKVKKIVD